MIAAPAPVPTDRAILLTPAERQMLALIGQLIARLDALQARVNDLEAWTAEVADDMLDRTDCPPALDVV